MHPDSMLISGVFASKLDQLILMSLLSEQMSDVASTGVPSLAF
jgi:hypothetical protein